MAVQSISVPALMAVSICLKVQHRKYMRMSRRDILYELEGTESALGLDQDAAAEVDDAIKRIGTVTLDKESLIEDIRKQYDALSDTAKPYVTGLSVLHDAEKELEQLKEEQDG